MSKLNRKIVWVLALGLIAGGLAVRYGDRLPLDGLAASAGGSSAIQGMIGKATRAQQLLEPSLKELEAAGEPDPAALDGVRARHDAAGTDLTLAWNLMNAHGTTTDIQGWYYAALRIQQGNAQRLLALTEKLATPVAPAAEEPPAEAPSDAAPSDAAPSDAAPSDETQK